MNSFSSWRSAGPHEASSSPSHHGGGLHIFEALIPGYQLYSGLLHNLLGVDITTIGLFLVVLWLLGTSISFLYGNFGKLMEPYLIPKVVVQKDDTLFSWIMELLAERKLIEDSNSIMAIMPQSLPLDDYIAAGLDKGGLYDHQALNLYMPLKYKLTNGTYHFWYRRRRFSLDYEDDQITLSCISRSTAVIKAFILDCRERGCNRTSRDNGKVRVYRPSSINRARWEHLASRASRPLHTVNIDPQGKRKIVLDMNEYLQQATAKWYEERGIPLRRGYLFHGPPGCGKSSMAFALAGLFGINMYSISLLDPELSEDDLCQLFTHLPGKAVVLLEDIDSAGLCREGASIGNCPNFRVPESSSSREDKRSNISLSGLLNVIDGVASYESAVLIMTTNHPERLDEALIRPGRVDMKVAFGLATREHIHHMFLRMYKPDELVMSVVRKAAAEADRLLFSDMDISASNDQSGLSTEVLNTGLASSASGEVLKGLAAEFAAMVPDKALSHAEVQGFLISHKTQPHRAIREVTTWRDDLLRSKNKHKVEAAIYDSQTVSEKSSDEWTETRG